MQENNEKIFSINRRIFEILEYYNVTRYKFSKLSGVSEATLLNIYKGKNKPSIDFLVKLLNTFKAINLNWLITGEGEMLQKDQGGKPPSATKTDDACKQEVEFYKRLLEKKEAELREAYKEIGRLEPYKKQTEGIDLPNQPKLTEKGENTNEKSQS